MLSLFTLSLEERSSQSPSPSTACSSFCVLSAFASSSLLSGCHPACPEGRRGRSRRERSEGSAFLSRASHSPIFHYPPTANRFRIRTYGKCASNPFRIRTSKTQDLKPFRIRTYRKTLGGEGVSLLVYPELRGPLATSPTSAARNGRHPHASVYLSAAQSVERASARGRCLNGRNS
jgi:hypothetical protein